MQNWQDERVIILGVARQGTALARYLSNQGASVVLTDTRSADELVSQIENLSDCSNLTWVLGEHPLSLLDEATLICPSGGVPLTIPFLQAARERKIPFSNDSQIFLATAPCPVIGITGSAGKTTTTTLIGRMLQAAADEGQFRQVWVGGNIGFPLIAHLHKMTEQDVVAMELSSFQLELMTRSPDIAVLLNIAPNHLDRHGTMAAYTAAKRHILEYQTQENTTVLGLDNGSAWAEQFFSPAKVLGFSQKELPPEVDGAMVIENKLILRIAKETTEILNVDEISLRGKHNILNILAACTAVSVLNVSPKAMRAGVIGFGGVPHRLEFVGNWDGISWFNDSKATGPAHAEAAIHAFENEPLIVLAGGKDKDLPWDSFAKTVAERVDHLILFGDAAAIIAKAVDRSGVNYTLDICAGLESAVVRAAELAEAGDVVLLAPGGTSYDEFKDFEERGDKFKQWVMALPNREGIKK